MYRGGLEKDVLRSQIEYVYHIGKCRGRDLNARQPRLQRGALPG